MAMGCAPEQPGMGMFPNDTMGMDMGMVQVCPLLLWVARQRLRGYGSRRRPT